MANQYGDLSNSGYATIQLKAFTGPISSGYKVSKFLGQKETLVQTKMSPNSSVRFEEKKELICIWNPVFFH